MFFLGDIALMLELLSFCLALVFLHYARVQNNGMVRTAAVILLIGSLILGACTSMAIYKRRALLCKELSLKDMKSDNNNNSAE